MSELDAPITEECSRCQGTGTVSWGIDVTPVVRETDGSQREVTKVCFSCGGVGHKATTQRKINRRSKDRERRELKRAEEPQHVAREAQRERMLQQEEVARLREEWEAQNPLAAQALTTLSGDFVAQMRQWLTEHGTLTEAQTAALVRMADEAPTAEVVTGRGEVTGKIISIKPVESTYGLEWKVVVRDDRGFKIYGTLPKALADALYGISCTEHDPSLDGDSGWTGFATGARVRFTATIQSGDDFGFGFYKRPVRAELLQRPE